MPASFFTNCLNLFMTVTMTTSMAALLWGRYLGWTARRELPTPAVGLGLSGGGLVGFIQHVCAMTEMDKLSPTLTSAGSGLVMSGISAGSLAAFLYPNAPNLWVPSIDDYASATAAELAALEAPEGLRGITAAGSLFDLSLLSECAACVATESRACEVCASFGDGFLPCLARGNGLWDCFITMFSEYYSFEASEATSGPWSVIYGSSLFNQPERQSADVDNGGVPQLPTPGALQNSAMLFTLVPPNFKFGTVELSNDNFLMRGEGVRTLGPLFRAHAYNARLLDSASTSSAFLGQVYHWNDEEGNDCQSDLDTLIGLETGTLPSLALQAYYLAQMRLLGSWKSEPLSYLRPPRANTGLVTDGAAMDRFAVVGLLRRRVPHIILIMHTAAPYSRVNSPGYLFGQNPFNASDSPCYSNFWLRTPANTMQVFDDSLWPQVDAALRNGTGSNSIKLTDVQVLGNEYFGIAPYTVETMLIVGQQTLDSFKTRMVG
jgi:hypothetical protein